MIMWKKTNNNKLAISDKLEYYSAMADEQSNIDEERSDDGRIVFSKIKTGKGIDRDAMATMVNRLEMTVVELVNLQLSNSHQTKVLKTATDALTTTINKANEENAKTQHYVLVLTIVGTFLAIAGVVEAINIISCWIGNPICII